MTKYFAISVFAAGILMGAPGLAHEGGELDAKEVRVELITEDDGDMRFKPDHLELEKGKLYELKLVNTSNMLHEFASDFMTRAVDTEKLEVSNADGQLMAEVVGGHPRGEIEVGPGTTVEWYLIPIKTGKRKPIVCDLPGHKEAGMVGTVTIREP